MICFVWLLFVATNVNITLGNIYLQFAVGCFVLLIIGITIFDRTLTISWQKENNGGNFKALLWGVGGWIVLLIASVITLRFIDPQNASIAAVMGLLGASTPALAQSKIANLITFGIAIAFIETQLWGRMLEFFSDFFKLNISKQSLRKIGYIILIVILSLAFMLFHLTAKGVANTSSLIVVFIMMAISLVMISIFGETRQAVFLHLVANTVASWLMLFASIKI